MTNRRYCVECGRYVDYKNQGADPRKCNQCSQQPQVELCQTCSVELNQFNKQLPGMCRYCYAAETGYRLEYSTNSTACTKSPERGQIHTTQPKNNKSSGEGILSAVATIIPIIGYLFWAGLCILQDISDNRIKDQYSSPHTTKNEYYEAGHYTGIYGGADLCGKVLHDIQLYGYDIGIQFMQE